MFSVDEHIPISIQGVKMKSLPHSGSLSAILTCALALLLAIVSPSSADAGRKEQ
jgi:hypothetical protein